MVKSYRWGGGVVAYGILVSPPVPIELGFFISLGLGLGLGLEGQVLGLGLDNLFSRRTLRIQREREPELREPKKGPEFQLNISDYLVGIKFKTRITLF